MYLVFGFLVLWKTGLFTEHFGDDKNQKRAAQAAAKQEINEGIADCGEHGMN
jgi:hypothetical protein